MNLMIELVSTSVLWGIIAAITLAVLILFCHSKEKRLGKMVILILMSLLLFIFSKVTLFSLFENMNFIFSTKNSIKPESDAMLVASFVVYPVVTTLIYSIIKATRKGVLAWIKTKDMECASVSFGRDFGASVGQFLSFINKVLRRIRDLDFTFELDEEETEREVKNVRS